VGPEKQGQEEIGDKVKEIPLANCCTYSMRKQAQGNNWRII
jgi:hypothetical protein